jgi:NAD(P)-dependent dehydrogenase (short-subunit alcohol dehydrogenase family)
MQASGNVPPAMLDTILAHTPTTRLGAAEDIAGLVAHLLSDQGRWINGQVYNINGGALMR